MRAAPGRLDRTTLGSATAARSSRPGQRRRAGVELLAFYPAARSARRMVTASGLDELRTIAAPGGNLYLVARATGGDWSLAATPPS